MSKGDHEEIDRQHSIFNNTTFEQTNIGIACWEQASIVPITQDDRPTSLHLVVAERLPITFLQLCELSVDSCLLLGTQRRLLLRGMILCSLRGSVAGVVAKARLVEARIAESGECERLVFMISGISGD